MYSLNIFDNFKDYYSRGIDEREIYLKKLLFLIFSMTFLSGFFYTSLNFLLFGVFLLKNFDQIKIGLHDKILFSCLLIIIIIKILLLPEFNTLVAIKSYYGFAFFYLVFLMYSDIKLDQLILVAGVFLLMEALLINVFDYSFLIKPYNGNATYKFFNFYNRPLGFGLNSSVTASLFCIILIGARRQNKIFNPISEIIAIVSNVITISGVGISIFLYYIVTRYSIFALCTLPFIFFFSESNVVLSHISWKFNLNYFNVLIDLKQSQLVELAKQFQNMSFVEIIFGKNIGVGGDFDLAFMFQSTGLLGYLILFWFIIKSLTWKNVEIIFLFLVCSLHYGVISSTVGQIFFAYFLAPKKEA